MMIGYAYLLAAGLAVAITFVLMLILIPILRRIKYGQHINEIGPAWHQNKEGTPTMGGIAFIIAIVAATVAALLFYLLPNSENLSPVFTRYSSVKLYMGILTALAFGFIGFIDDFVKVVKKRNLGLTEKQKLLLQFFVAAVFLLSQYIAGDRATHIYIPYIATIELGIFYYPLMMFFIVGFVNAVNLTDGIDGLCGSVTFVVALGFMVISTLTISNEMGILAAATAGGMIGYLIFNAHPAKVFMGDTGSMFLGGIVVVFAFSTGTPFILLLAGIVYLLEALSVILQVLSVKIRKKRIFKMSPIHHHFEMTGWSEQKIVLIFSGVTLLGVIAAIYNIYSLYII